MNYLEILVRTEIYLQKISAEMTNEANKEDLEILKKAMEIIEKIALEEE